MHDSSRTYFEDRIRTASPERLQWMLLDGALQAARRAESLLAADRALQAGANLAQVEAILTEIVGAMNKEVAPQLVERSTSVYAYMIRRLIDAHMHNDAQALRDVIRVLEVEHETWRQVCERNVAAVPPPAPHIAGHGAAPQVGDYASGGFSAQA